eukprot:1976548-Prymnesium_polylepis.1
MEAMPIANTEGVEDYPIHKPLYPKPLFTTSASRWQLRPGLTFSSYVAASRSQDPWSMAQPWPNGGLSCCDERLSPGHARPNSMPRTQSSWGRHPCSQVEDDEFHQQVFMKYFDKANELNFGVVYDLTIMASGQEAFDVLTKPDSLSPDLVLIDVMMEGLSGDELLLALRGVLRPEVAVVMVSSASRAELVKKCLDNGADGYLVKPVPAQTIQLAWQYCYQ